MPKRSVAVASNKKLLLFGKGLQPVGTDPAQSADLIEAVVHGLAYDGLI